MNIVLIGYGKMGREIEAIAIERGHIIAERFDEFTPLTPTLAAQFPEKNIHCCIDFSIPSATPFNITTVSAMQIPIVVGTTGWNKELDTMKKTVLKNNSAMVYGSNFSVGAQIFFQIVSAASALMNNFSEYDVAVHEIHHTMKKDAPSGTALTIAEKILSQLKQKTIVKFPTDISPMQKNELLVSSSRVGSVFGTHTVQFNSFADDIELTHRAHNRKGFALGAVLAAEWIQSRKGVYSVEEFLFGTT